MNDRVEISNVSLTDLEDISKDILKLFPLPEIFLFYGEMGSGKTTLIKALCRVAGVNIGLSSPTYGIANEYLTDTGEIIYHLDLYRIHSDAEAFEAGIYEYLESHKTVMIEWPERVNFLKRKGSVEIKIETLQNNKRSISAYRYE